MAAGSEAWLKIVRALSGTGFTSLEAESLKSLIDARIHFVDDDPVIPKSTATAECALAAVYTAIEKQVDLYDNGDILAGLAALVNALKPRTPLPTSGQVYVNNDATLGTLPQYNEL